MAKDAQSNIYRVMDKFYFLFLIISLIVYIITRNLRIGFIAFIAGVIVTFIVGNIFINYKTKKQ
ncbi:MAG: hypothetical protein K0R54_325 [Clostridiaceae bacterium]|jgi:hypothetical protein|nr:hypothetical protein [Clostridiaceae bacterium]